jgi:hypothetical protein
MRKQTQITQRRHEPSYKQLGVKTNQQKASFQNEICKLFLSRIKKKKKPPTFAKDFSNFTFKLQFIGNRRGRHHMVVGFITTYAISTRSYVFSGFLHQ